MSTRGRLHKQDIVQTWQVNSFETFTRREQQPLFSVYHKLPIYYKDNRQQTSLICILMEGNPIACCCPFHSMPDDKGNTYFQDNKHHIYTLIGWTNNYAIISKRVMIRHVISLFSRKCI